MGSFEIIKAGMMTSIQDLGRKGLAYFAIPTSGVMDKNAAQVALLILNKKENCPLIECTSSAPEIKFSDAIRIVITGADFNWKLNNKPINRNSILSIKKNDILKGSFSKDGLRGYIALDGDLEIDQIYDSFSTYTNAKLGGYQGRLLQKGDVLRWKNSNFIFSKNKIIPIKKGPEFFLLSKKSIELLTTNIYRIGIDSNRMGIRLEGEKLGDSNVQLENSVPVLPGFIQLPPSGLPIIVLQDGQTTGGYPRIAYIQDQYLSALNQIPLGGEFQFQLI
ncbi:MAG: biotin-dependent carboxyltransferase family protein [Saprospiraceae bacterium]